MERTDAGFLRMPQTAIAAAAVLLISMALPLTAASPDTSVFLSGGGSMNRSEARHVPLKPGDVIARVRVSADSFVYFPGRFTPSAFDPARGLSSFRLPVWMAFADALSARFREICSGQPDDADDSIVYLDGGRVYVRGMETYYCVHGFTCIPLEGRRARPEGGMALASDPAGAAVIVGGVNTGMVTPATVTGLFCGEYTVELRLPHHEFLPRRVIVFEDSVVTVSCEYLADMDTAYIFGSRQFGLLAAAGQPDMRPFIIDQTPVDKLPVRLSGGVHRVCWDGRGIRP